MKTNISKEQIDFYKQMGFLVIDNILPDDLCDKCLNQMEKHTDDFSAIMNPDRPEFLISQSLDKINNLENLHERTKYISLCLETSSLMLSILKYKKAVDILETLQNEKVVGLMSQMLFKKAGSKYSTQAWTPHQDNAYPRNKNGKYITTNFFLRNANKENGTLYIYEKSHISGLFDAEERVSYREKVGTNPGNTISEKILKNYKKTIVNFKKGSLLVLNGNVIHGSLPNNSKNDRPLFSCSYISKNEEFIPGYNAQRKIIPLD